MSVRFLVACGMACIAAVPAFAQDITRVPAEARPVSVTVYNDQATVTRGGQVEVQAGNSIVVISGVPAGVLADSVSARGRSAAPVVLGAVEVRQTTWDPVSATARRAEIEAAIRATYDAVEALEVKTAAFEAQRAMVMRMSEAATTPPAAGRGSDAGLARHLTENPSAWKPAWETTRAGIQEAAEGLRLVAQEKRAVLERRDALAKELAAAGVRPQGTLEFAVAVSAERVTKLELFVTYQVRGASWRPVYDARLDTTTDKLALRQEAVVTQATGEDWKDVTIVLSTSRPSAGVTPPVLSTWRIGLADPAAARLRGSLASGSTPTARADMPATANQKQLQAEAVAPVTIAQPPAEVPVDAVAAAAVVNATGLSVEYAVPGVATVVSGATERRVRIGETVMDTAMSVRTVPRVDPRGYLVARFANATKTPLLPGAVALYLDGVFVGRGQLALARPDEQVRLPFGPDDRVKITYEPQDVSQSTERTMLLSRRQVNTAVGLTTVRSFHAKPMAIAVFDQIPVSSDEDLKVDLIADPQPTESNVDNRPGVLAWTWTLKPGEERKLRFGYTVNSPDGKVVTGAPR